MSEIDKEYEEWLEVENKLEKERIFHKFEEKFHFHPSIHKEEWPGIKEPFYSVTYDVSEVYHAHNRRDLELDLQAKVAKAFESILTPTQFIYVWDWQHHAYKFQPRTASIYAWKTPAFPDGDYYIFLTEDLENGIFGHPHEKSICVFGSKFLQALEENKPKMFTKVLRKVAGQDI